MSKLRVGIDFSTAALIDEWKSAVAGVKTARRLEDQAVLALAMRARGDRANFTKGFTKKPWSRQVTLDGGKAGKVVVKNTAIFGVAKGLGQSAKKMIYKFCSQTRNRYIQKYGAEHVERIELVARVGAHVADQKNKADLTKTAASALFALPLSARPPARLTRGMELVERALQPTDSKLSVKEVK